MSAGVLDLTARLAASLADNSIPTPAPGVYASVPMADYHRWQPAASNSRLSQLHRSPAHLKAYLQQPPEDTAALVMGRATHTAILEPDDFTARYVQGPAGDRRTKAVKEAWDALVTSHGDGYVLKPADYAACLKIRDAVHVHSSAKALLAGAGQVELSIVWADVETGVACKGRLDRFTPLFEGVIVDLKSTRDASRRAFERSIFDYGYHRQGALYLDGTEANAIEAKHYAVLAFEKEPPYAIAVYRLTDGAIQAGRDQVRPLITRYAECLEKNEWPAYGEEIEDISVPEWAWRIIAEETTPPVETQELAS